MKDQTGTATNEPTIVTVFEQNDAEGATLEVAVMRSRRWQLLTVEQARDLANELLEAADLAEALSEELDDPDA
jgi:hypothetical protein